LWSRRSRVRIPSLTLRGIPATGGLAVGGSGAAEGAGVQMGSNSSRDSSLEEGNDAHHDDRLVSAEARRRPTPSTATTSAGWLARASRDRAQRQLRVRHRGCRRRHRITVAARDRPGRTRPQGPLAAPNPLRRQHTDGGRRSAWSSTGSSPRSSLPRSPQECTSANGTAAARRPVRHRCSTSTARTRCSDSRLNCSRKLSSRELVGDEVQRRRALKRDVGGAVDDAHPATAGEGDDAVPRRLCRRPGARRVTATKLADSAGARVYGPVSRTP